MKACRLGSSEPRTLRSPWGEGRERGQCHIRGISHQSVAPSPPRYYAQCTVIPCLPPSIAVIVKILFRGVLSCTAPNLRATPSPQRTTTSLEGEEMPARATPCPATIRLSSPTPQIVSNTATHAQRMRQNSRRPAKVSHDLVFRSHSRDHTRRVVVAEMVRGVGGAELTVTKCYPVACSRPISAAFRAVPVVRAAGAPPR
jgi:hypothetical protein